MMIQHQTVLGEGPFHPGLPNKHQPALHRRSGRSCCPVWPLTQSTIPLLIYHGDAIWIERRPSFPLLIDAEYVSSQAS